MVKKKKVDIEKLTKPITDDRGSIQNLIEGEDIKGVSIITSKVATERSNHYHQKDWHYLYVISGSMLYYERDPGGKKEGPGVNVSKGQMIFTPPNRVHMCRFLEDTVLLCLSKMPKDEARHDMVKEEF